MRRASLSWSRGDGLAYLDPGMVLAASLLWLSLLIEGWDKRTPEFSVVFTAVSVLTMAAVFLLRESELSAMVARTACDGAAVVWVFQLVLGELAKVAAFECSHNPELCDGEKVKLHKLFEGVVLIPGGSEVSVGSLWTVCVAFTRRWHVPSDELRRCGIWNLGPGAAVGWALLCGIWAAKWWAMLLVLAGAPLAGGLLLGFAGPAVTAGAASAAYLGHLFAASLHPAVEWDRSSERKFYSTPVAPFIALGGIGAVGYMLFWEVRLIRRAAEAAAQDSLEIELSALPKASSAFTVGSDGQLKVFLADSLRSA